MTLARLPAHRIARISYSLDVLECTCGQVMRAKGGLDWAEHRAAVGVPHRTLSGHAGRIGAVRRKVA